MIRLQKKSWLGVVSKPADQPLHHPSVFSGGSNNAYNACEFDGRYSSRAALCSKTSGKMDNRRSSYSNCVGNTRSRSPGIRSRNDMQDNQRLLRLLLSRLKPERQLVLPEPKPVRLLPMEVKEVFSSGPPILEFQFVTLRVCKKSRLFLLI